ncbi:MAG: peptide ABC transporter substrate-binding protein [Rhodobacterales bacterium]|nr:peptide ABC transporter substrate-binding protein [Rhodobacterales bacterium]
MTFSTILKASTAVTLIAWAGFATAAEVTLAAGEKLAADQTFTYRTLDQITTMDPGMAEDNESGIIIRDLFEGLYNQDGDGNVVPGVALSHTVSEDGLTYTFTLRPEAVWSNGDPVVAADFVYGWRRAASPELASPYSWYISLMGVENADAVIAGEMPTDALGIKAIDDHTLEVRITAPKPYFPQMVTMYTTFPVNQKAVEANPDSWLDPANFVGNGAYVLTENVPAERTVRERNPLYWDNANTVIEKVTSLVINDENQALTRYLAGELDKTEVPTGQYPRLLEEYPTQAVSFPLLCSYYYNVNLTETGNPALQDVRVRQALSLAIDRDIVVNNVLAGGQVPAYSLTHWATAGFEVPTIEAAGMTQADRNAKAVELMTEAGFGPGGEPLTVDILYNTSDAHKTLAVAISQMWKQTLGVETTLANQEWQTFLDARGAQNYQLARAGWCGDYNEASTFLDIMSTASGYNDSKYSNPEYDALLEQAKTAADPAPLYEQAEQILAADLPLIPVYHYASVFMLNDSIRDWPVGNVQQNTYTKDIYKVEAE